jgi:hypothetical protein
MTSKGAACVPATFCPHCNYELTAATPHDGGPDKPRPGDWSVCFSCGGLLRFDGCLRSVAGSATELAREPPGLRHLVQRLQATARRPRDG